MDDYRSILRKLTIRDEVLINEILRNDGDDRFSHLDPRTHALLRIGALIGMDAAPIAYGPPVEAALEAGATVEQTVGTLVALMPTLGTARIVSAAPKLGLAVGYDVLEALEQLDPDD